MNAKSVSLLIGKKKSKMKTQRGDERMMKHVLLFPIKVIVWTMSAAFRLLSSLFAYVIGAVMLLGLAAGVYMAVEQRWEQVGLILCLEVVCLVIQFAEEMLILGMDWVRNGLKKI